MSTSPIGEAPRTLHTDGAAPKLIVDVPQYDRRRLTPAVVHLGVGAFHRAHQAVYFDELAAKGHTAWGIVGVGISRPELGEVLNAQDNLYVVVERSADASTARVVGTIVEYLLLAEDRDSVVRRLADPRTRLVTMTVTGDGYRTDDEPSPVFSAIAEALEIRSRTGLRPFTVLSCDNLPDSGASARQATIAAARLRSDVLAEWVEREATFPSSMVDRITPTTSPELREAIEQEFHVRDSWPVVTEPFSQWVVEDRFCDGRPPLDEVGVRFVDDVTPYKLVKTRLLNGTHSALGYLGALAGCGTTAEAMDTPEIARIVERLMRDEMAPALPDDVEGMELDPYQKVLLERFASPTIADDLSRLCRRGSTKMRDYLLPSLHAAVADGRSAPLLCLVVAAWCRYLQGVDDAGHELTVEDPRLDELQPLARRGAADLLAVEDLFGAAGRDQDIVRCVQKMLESIEQRGVLATIDGILPLA
jgi:mannitol 2-dehydrogenase